MNVTRQPFGEYQDKKIDQYILKNENGLTIKIITYGATITSMLVPTPQGDLVEIACGFDTLGGYFSKDYRNNAPYFGCTVGRYASRIKDGRFEIDERNYSLAINDGSNHLHGGISGFDKQVWAAETVEDRDEVGVKMSLNSPDGDEGYPGNVQVTANFRLNNDNELAIHYFAETDKATPLSLTNHTYFNLSGFQDTIENHRVQIYADTFLTPDKTNVPVGKMASVENTPSDLRTEQRLGEAISKLATGFEHYYCFAKFPTLQKVARFSEPTTNLGLEVSTTEPGMLFYTGYFTSDKLQRESGDQYGRYRGFCCETSRYPNGPNLKNAPDSLTFPGTPYESTTTFRFITTAN